MMSLYPTPEVAAAEAAAAAAKKDGKAHAHSVAEARLRCFGGRGFASSSL
jgi:hypothetical protein